MPLLFWLLAAFLVAGSHATLDRWSIAGGAAAEIASIVVAGYCYMRFAARDATVDHAYAVGVAWLLLAMVVEIAAGQRVVLLGSPVRPVLRNIFLFVWIFAPALFARRERE
jgi:hypothetical protein